MGNAIEKSYDLGDGILVHVTYRELGQMEPGDRDDVIVTAQVRLPLAAECEGIPNVLKFRNRLWFMGAPLNSGWGDHDYIERYAYRNEQRVNTTYAAAYAQLATYIDDQINKLRNMIQSRRNVLANAGTIHDVS